MDSDEAARAVFTRIQAIDPHNASKIIAFILLQKQAEKEMIRLAFGPDILIHSVISAAKTQLGLSSNTSCAPNTPLSPPLFSPVSNPISISRPTPLPPPSLRIPHNNGFNPSSPSSPSIWSVSPSDFSSPPGSRLNRDSFADNYPFHEQDLSFPPKNVEFVDQSREMATSPGCRSDSLLYPCRESGSVFEKNGYFSRRSCSVDDSFFVSDDSTSGFGYKPRPYNKFDALEQCQLELMRLKAAQRQRLAAAQYMSGVNVDLPCNKLNFLQKESQRSAAAALIMGEELHRLNRYRMRRYDFSGLGCGDSNHASRQIYLTFPADSTFKEEDVSNYFSMYGPVQDVRIPFQQKRMFGFVTFVYAETVTVILAKSNPHFICDSRVLVKPYKEKGELLDKKQQQQQSDRSESFSFGSPSSLDIREPFEMHVGPRLLYKNHEMMLRKKLEQEAHWEQALEHQNRRMMNLQLLESKNHHGYQQNPPLGSPPYMSNQNIPVASALREDASEDNNIGSPNGSPTRQVHEEFNAESDAGNAITKEDDPEPKKSNFPESSERVLHDTLFASPTNFAADEQSGKISKPVGLDNAATISYSAVNNDTLTPPASTLNVPSLKSCFLEIPRVSSGHEAIGM